MTADAFSTFARGLDGPYARAVALTPASGEVAPTAAVWINCRGLLTLTLADDSASVTIAVDPGLYHLRVKQVSAFTLGSCDLFAETGAPAVVGLY